MLAWFSENLGTIIVSIILLLVVGFVIFIMIRDKRSGKSGCSHGCQSCAMSGESHKRAEEFKRKKAAGEL